VNLKKIIKNFFLPRVDTKYLVRIFLIVILSYITFKYFLIPMKIHGESMEPTYKNGTFNFCRTFLCGKFKRGDIVAIKLAGSRIMYLKRIIALEGDTIEFKNGTLFINSVPKEEEYVKYPCDWNLSARTVEKGKVYVIGDNRSMPIELHLFGEVELSKIAGKPLW